MQQFIAKVSADGSTLLFSTYLTGKLGATPMDIALGPDGSIYTVGSVQAPDYPVTGGAPIGTYPAKFVDTLCSCNVSIFAYATSRFVSRVSGDGTKLLYSTFLGGSQWDFLFDHRGGQGREHGGGRDFGLARFPRAAATAR